MNVDAYITLRSGVVVSHQLEKIEDRVELHIDDGSGAIHLIIDHPKVLEAIAKEAVLARGEFINHLRREINAAELAGDPVAARVRELAFPGEDAPEISGPPTPVTGTFDEVEGGAAT